MKDRIKSAGIMLVIVIAFFALRFINESFFDILIGIMIGIAGFEVSKTYDKQGKRNYKALVVIYSVCVFIGLEACFLFNATLEYFLLIQSAILVLFVLLAQIMPVTEKEKLRVQYEKDRSNLTYEAYTTRKSLYTMLMYIYPVIYLVPMYFINRIDYFLPQKQNLGLLLLVIIFVICSTTDTCAYLVGRKFKGAKLSPSISPNKTVSGAIGGLLGGIIVSALIYIIFNSVTGYAVLLAKINLKFSNFIMLGLFVSVVNQIGDLIESAIKRKIKVKDFGKIFPGHGGMMDRIDGISFSTIIVLLIFILVLA